MKTSRKTKLHFAEMPREYAALCMVYLPRPIHDKAEYGNMVEIAAVFAGFEAEMTADQADYFDLICSLLAAWETAHVKPPKRTPVQTLKHLLEEHDLKAVDLSRILRSSAKLGAMILRGDRSITADHARKLGGYFNLPAGTFI